MSSSSSSVWVQSGKAAITGALCLILGAPQAFALLPETPAPRDPDRSPVKSSGALDSQQKVLHALNRFTFGPRPGDEAAVTRMGVDAWFEQQLHPQKIDDSGLDARLQAFPALQLSQEELMRRFPSPAVVRQITRRGGSLPSDPVDHAIYADAIAAYSAKKQDKVAAGRGAATGPGMQDGGSGAPPAVQMNPETSETAAGVGKTQRKSKKKANVAPLALMDVDALIALPPEQRMQRLIGMSPEEMLSFRAAVRGRQRLELLRGLSPEQIEIAAALQGGPIRVIGAEALESRLLRDVYSERQLQAVMTDFWLNHFSVYARKNQNEPYYLASYENQTVLPNALGKFENLLVATAESPAMLMYLDNWQSIGPDSPAATRVKRFGKFAPNLAQAMPKGLNENYARELMELHTLGVNGGYTQKDVIEVAKCFTGWTIDRPYQGGGGFHFEENRHEGGSKVVLGRTIPEGGMNEGLTVLHMLATSPATAHFISNKLAVRFVSDDPPAALVNQMASTFSKTHGDISAVLRTMFHSAEFNSPQVYRAKLKTPIEFMASALRASNATVNNPLPLVQAMDQLGMPIYGMQTPNGYSWESEPWASSNALVSRMNFAVVLSGDRVPGTHTDWSQLTGEPASGATPATEHKLENLILGQPAAERTRAAVLQEASDPNLQKNAAQNFALGASAEDDADVGPVTMKRKRAGKAGANLLRSDVPESPLDTMAGLLLGSPEFQRR